MSFEQLNLRSSIFSLANDLAVFIPDNLHSKSVLIDDSADFIFRETEPSSPVPYLIERAVRWANMSVTDWLNELLPDKEAIHKINEVLKGNN